MKIQFVIGGTGYGKSHYLYEKILKEAEENLTKKYYVIVPEQVNLQVQRELVRMSERKGIMNVDVLSFIRLAHRTYLEEGLEEKLILDDTGKSMVIRKLLNHLGSEFYYFKKAGKKLGFTEEMKSIVTELMQYSVDEEGIDELLKREDLPFAIKEKLHDIRLIFSAFCDYKREKYIVAEKLLEIVSEVIINSNLYKDAVFVFDGFTGFTPTQFKIIASLMTRARAMFFAFTMDKETFYEKKTADYKLFYLSKSMILKLEKLAMERSAEVKVPVFIEAYKDKGAISEIESTIFRTRKKKKFSDTLEQVSIHALRSLKDEAEFILMKIWGLVKDEGYRFKEIAIVTGDMEEYGEVIFNTLKKGGIPTFLDRKKTIFDNPFIEFIRASLLVVEENFSYEAVIRYLRSGFSGIWKSRADFFQNFLLKKGIKGRKKYSTPFFGYSELDESIEYIRNKVYLSFEPLFLVLKDKKKNTKDKTLALYDFIKSHRAEEKLYVMRRAFEEKGEMLRSKEYEKCYQIVMTILEKMVELLGDEVFDSEEFGKILEAGLLEGKAGFIPSGLDQVVIGDIKRTRLSGVKVLFLVGMNDGKIPKTASKKGIFTDREREKLGKLIELAPNTREKTFMELFYLYMLFSTPKDKLIISYSSSGPDGKARRKSYLVDKILSLFEGKEVSSIAEKEENLIHEIRKDGGLSHLLKLFRKGELSNKESMALIRYYLEKEEGLLKNLIAGYKARPIGEKLSYELALRLYGNVKGSITRLESFVECPFSHFLTYGLSLREREEFELQSFELGTIYHEILERFSKKTLEIKDGFTGLPEATRQRFIDESIEETVKAGYDILLSSGKNRYKLLKIRRIVDKTTWILANQIEAGDFKPTLFEEAFVSENMKGRIDRIDTALSEFLPDGTALFTSDKEEYRGYAAVEYARVVDYKSGNKTFDINDTYYGLDLQLVAYLRHLEGILKSKPKHEKNLIIPVGAYYYHIDDPIRRKGEGDEVFLKKLKLSGLTKAEPYSLYLSDHSLASVKEERVEFFNSVQSKVINVSTKKDGDFSKTSDIYKAEDLKSLIDFSKTQMKKIREDILQGKISPSPYKMGDKKGCDYCKYESICRFKARLDGYNYRIFKNLSEEAIFEKIKEKNGEKVDD